MAGDPNQLGPDVFSTLAKSYGLGQSMLARFIDHALYRKNLRLFPENYGFNPKIITHLKKNYRSLPEIVHNFSELFYDSLLETTVSNNKCVSTQTLWAIFNLNFTYCRNLMMTHQKEFC